MRKSWMVIQPSYHPRPRTRVMEMGHPYTHRIYELLEYVKGMILQSQNSRTLMTQDKDRISISGPSNGPLAWYSKYQRPQTTPMI